ncbi:flippase-like domain-containing protein [Planctomycetota bacterium]|nr:flippase-like domain-containing protein [Planctomycetota bacterium]
MTDPDLTPSPPTGGATSVIFDEVRRERGTAGTRRRRLLRGLGLVVFALAAWLISRNISWQDEVRVEARSGAETLVIQGSIESDWRTRPLRFLCSSTVESLDLTAGQRLIVKEEMIVTHSGVELVSTSGEPGAFQADLIDVRPGMAQTLSGVEAGKLSLAFALLALASLTVATRWWRLLGVHHCPTRWLDAVRFTYVGLFFNVIFPGFNGGDVARAVAVVQRHPDRRPEALMSVVVDRVLGLLSMVMIGTVFVLSCDHRAADLKAPVTAAATGLLLGGVVYCSAPIRRWIHLDALLARLPFGEQLARLDSSARLVVARPVELSLALLLSCMNHLLTGAAVSFIAAGLGSRLGFAEWMSTTAIANTISGLPISPGGLGVGEHLFGSLAAIFGSTYAMGVATSLIFRLGLYGLSMLGGLALLLPGRAVPPAERAQG